MGEKWLKGIVSVRGRVGQFLKLKKQNAVNMYQKKVKMKR